MFSNYLKWRNWIVDLHRNFYQKVINLENESKIFYGKIRENWTDYLIYLSLLPLGFIVFILFISVFASIFPIIYITKEIFLNSPMTLQSFVKNVAPLIDFALLDSVLIIVAIGIYVIIIMPLKEERRFRLKETTENILQYLGLPFLSMVLSILTVSILEIVAELYILLQSGNKNFDDQIFFRYVVMVLIISVAIIAISLLMKIEYGFSNVRNQTNDNKKD
jgi:hypothetical protein